MKLAWNSIRLIVSFLQWCNLYSITFSVTFFNTRRSSNNLLKNVDVWPYPLAAFSKLSKDASFLDYSIASFIGWLIGNIIAAGPDMCDSRDALGLPITVHHFTFMFEQCVNFESLTDNDLAIESALKRTLYHICWWTCLRLSYRIII